MMIVLALAPMILFGVWLMRRVALMKQATSSDPCAVPAVPAPGLDDGADCLSATHGAWTALDERNSSGC